MTITAILLLAVSSLLHAVWNFISKNNSPSSAFFLVANIFGSLIFIPVVIIFLQEYLTFPLRVWGLVLAAGLFQAIYFSSLAGAYRNGNISLAYPLVRASTVLIVTAVTFLLDQGEKLSCQCLMGVVLVFGGCLLVPMERFSKFSFKNYLNVTCGLALIAAAGSAGYSIVDDESLRTLLHGMVKGKYSIFITMLYAFVEALATVLWLAIFVVLNRNRRREFVIVCKKNKQAAFFAGTGVYVTYTLVLISMLWVDNVSYVVGFRQMSIPVGAFLGVILLKEPLEKPKIFGILILLSGLMFMGTG